MTVPAARQARVLAKQEDDGAVQRDRLHELVEAQRCAAAAASAAAARGPAEVSAVAPGKDRSESTLRICLTDPESIFPGDSGTVHRVRIARCMLEAPHPIDPRGRPMAPPLTAA